MISKKFKLKHNKYTYFEETQWLLGCWQETNSVFLSCYDERNYYLWLYEMSIFATYQEINNYLKHK